MNGENSLRPASSWPPSSTHPVVVAEALHIAEGAMHRVETTEAHALWIALVTGQLSIAFATEAKGKRILVARRNRGGSDSGDKLALTAEESAVVWLASEGHSLKYMAHELDVSIAMLVRRLKSATQKLGIGSRRELLRRLGTPLESDSCGAPESES
ncbi:hypothetical protein BH09MYX1_BH09MYX1_36520 [soil metagenome]